MSALIRHDSLQVRVASGITILLGVWLIASPWVFVYSGRLAVLNALSVGALIAMLAAIRLALVQLSLVVNRVNVALGFWTIISPWVSGYVANKPAVANNIMVGVLVMSLSIWSARAPETKPRQGAQ